MTSVLCYDAQGNAVTVPSESILFRPAVYGVMIENEQVLLLPHPQTGLWHPPGCTLLPRQTPVQAIRHHFRSALGVVPKIGPLLFVEDQYRVDEHGQAWHLSVLYYALERPPMAPATLPESEGVPQPEFVSLEQLGRAQMQFGYEAIQAGRFRLQL